jgi:hypothetical protein
MRIAATSRLKVARILPAIAILVVAAYLSGDWVFGDNRYPWPIDFQVFWSSGRRPLGDVYADHGMPFVYPPTSLFLFKPFGLISFLPSYFVWISISTALFGLAVARACGATTSAVAFLSPAATRSITLGQSAMLLGGAMFASLQMQPLIRGLIFGFIAVTKPQLVLFAPIAFLVRREWMTLAGMAGGCTLAVLASLVAFGPWIWFDWLRALPDFHALLIRHDVLAMAITPMAQAEHLGLPAIPILALSATVALVTVLIIAKRVEDELLIALIVGASLAAAPYAHTHDTIALIPACIALLFKGHWVLAIMAALVITGTPALTPVGLLGGLIIAAFFSSYPVTRDRSEKWQVG